ncbi:MAG: UDP-N-acetylmuramate--alanine ligase [Paracoccaceae bacterium]|nr:UDP-N-acetylmuramate--alanine ligase [Loktanella sp.]
MGQIYLLAIMIVGAVIPFAAMTYWVQRGRNGFALSLVSVIGGALVLLLFASVRPVGADPLMAMAWAQFFVFPGFIGALAGGLLGWLVRRRRDGGR